MKSEARVVPLDASIRRQVLELAREHDARLKGLEQDLFRAETQLKVERRWRWVDRVICLAVGLGLAIAAMQTGFLTQVWIALREGGRNLAAYLWTSVDVFGLPVPLNALIFSSSVLVLALVLAAIMSLRPSPQRAARELMRRVDRDPAVQGFVFQNGTFPKSSYDDLREEAGRSKDDLDFPPPTLELQMHSILHPVATRRTLQ